MKYLLAVSIGPVQEFIAAARRCRDLWFGSHLLSEVSKAAAKRLAEHGDLIFPSTATRVDLDPGSDFTVVNKLLASVETDDIEGLMGEAQAAAHSCLEKAADRRALQLRGLEIEWDRYAEQLATILEFYAAWTPHTDYRSARARVERLAAARKALRHFPTHRGIAGEPKSSLDGVREHVIRRRSKALYQSNLKDNEWLDAIGVVKRFGGGYAPFDSTLDVAAAPYVKGRIRSCPEVMRRYDEFLAKHGLHRRTYGLLYRHESRQIFTDDEVDQADLKDIREQLGREPSPPYYGFLVGDGDRMGEAISGIETVEAHKDFSRRLSGFASQARDLIDNQYEGCSIYCGGDDVVALLPLHTALACAQAVNKLFRGAMNRAVTFSAGLVIAHALEPLTEVREWARRAEGTAKREGNRDALCVAVHPRSGGDVKVVGKWHQLPGLLDRIVELYGDKETKFSLGLAHEFRDLIARTEDWEEMHEAVPDLATAIARRKQCADEAVSLVGEYATDLGGLDRLCNAMLVARPFARARKEAG